MPDDGVMSGINPDATTKRCRDRACPCPNMETDSHKGCPYKKIALGSGTPGLPISIGSPQGAPLQILK